MVDRRGWVQHKRVEHLVKSQDKYRFWVLTARQFLWAWKSGILRNRPIAFSTWRIVHRILKSEPEIFSDDDFRWFLGAVTSHSNIGGGLDPDNPIPNRRPDEALHGAAKLLNRFNTVTVNSRILWDLLDPIVEGIVYCPNGVDCDFYNPGEPSAVGRLLRVGWAGKIRGPKNFPVIKDAFRLLENMGHFETDLVVVDKEMKSKIYGAKAMRDYYRGLDYYICASWNEGTPNPALEAAACGVPVITTRVGNMPDLIVDGVNGFFIEPTVESIIERMCRCRGIPNERYRRMRCNIRQTVLASWSWQEKIGNFVRAFDLLTQ